MLLVGQAPSRNSNPAFAFSGRSGERLIALSGLTYEEFWGRVDAVNLVIAWPGKAGPKGDKFPLMEARKAAVAYMSGLAVVGPEYAVFVLCGRAVARAFDLEFLDWFKTYGIPRFAVIPHPSGVNHMWNDPRTTRQARRFFRRWLPR